MRRILILGWNGDAAAAVVQETERLGLRISRDDRLASYPGSRHWHLKKGNQPGTLEVTLWPPQGRLWVDYHGNRAGDGWVEEAAAILAAALAERLQGRAEYPDGSS